MNILEQRREFDINIPEEEITRLLGYGEHPIPDRVRTTLSEIQEACVPLIQTARSLVRVGTNLLSQSPFLRKLDDVVLCLVTIGDGVEQLAEQYERDGELGRALIANVYGSAAAEAAADAANTYIRNNVEQSGLFCSRRYSPGYGGWDVAEQRWLLPLLEGERLGVTLTGGCMMVPRKSVTFAVSVGAIPTEMRSDNECDSCDLTNCRYRRQTVVKEKDGKACTTFIAPESIFCPRDKWS